MSRIDVAGHPELIQTYFKRTEVEDRGAWQCLHCAMVFTDDVAFRPPDPHDCAMLHCSWCLDRTPGASSGICPYHLALATGEKKGVR